MKTAMIAPALSLLATAAAKEGTEQICLGPRSHVITYNFTGHSLDEIEDATISVQPDLASNDLCAPSPYGDKTMCVGANVDETCRAAAKDIPLWTGSFSQSVDCPSCFAGLTTDLYYKLNIKHFELKEVEVGLQNSHLRAAAEVHGHTDKAVTLPSGKVTLISEKSKFKADFMVANIIPVKIEVAVPTTFNYALGFKGSVDATAGATLDVNLGDHSVKYENGSGFSVINDKPSYTFTPNLNVDVEAEADLSLGMDSTVAISVDKVISYDVKMQPKLPLEMDLEDSDKHICIEGSADFVLSHEADVHFSLFGKKHDVYHYGPKQLYHYHKDDVFKKCIDVPKSDATVVV